MIHEVTVSQWGLCSGGVEEAALGARSRVRPRRALSPKTIPFQDPDSTLNSRFSPGVHIYYCNFCRKMCVATLPFPCSLFPATFPGRLATLSLQLEVPMRSQSIWTTLFALAILSATLSAEERPDTQIRVIERDGKSVVEVLSGDSVLLASPDEGLWSLASDWQDGWPTGWHHVQPESVAKDGPWTILQGSLETEAGTWRFRDAYRPPRSRLSSVCADGEWHGRRCCREDDAGRPMEGSRSQGPDATSGNSLLRQPFWSGERPNARILGRGSPCGLRRAPLPIAPTLRWNGRTAIGVLGQPCTACLLRSRAGTCLTSGGRLGWTRPGAARSSFCCRARVRRTVRRA